MRRTERRQCTRGLDQSQNGRRKSKDGGCGRRQQGVPGRTGSEFGKNDQVLLRGSCSLFDGAAGAVNYDAAIGC